MGEKNTGPTSLAEATENVDQAVVLAVCPFEHHLEQYSLGQYPSVPYDLTIVHHYIVAYHHGL